MIYRLILLWLYVSINFTLYAQSNNPLNYIGLEYLDAREILIVDAENGELDTINQEIIDFYIDTLSFTDNIGMNTDLASDVFTAVKNNYAKDVIMASDSLSSTSKTILIGLIVQSPDYDSLTTVALRSQLIESEENLVLSLIAIAYNLNKEIISSSQERRPLCSASSGQQSGTIDCETAGIVIGATIGFGICGWACALGRAIVGGVIGAVT